MSTSKSKSCIHQQTERKRSENLEKIQNKFLNFYLQKDKINYLDLNEKNIKLNVLKDSYEKNKFISAKNIENHLHYKKFNMHLKINNELKKFEIGHCGKILRTSLYFLIYPIIIFLSCIILEITSGLIALFLGLLLLFSIIGLPIFVIFYFTVKEEKRKDFYFYLISLNWISFVIIFKGLYYIFIGVFLAIYLFFKSFYLICNKDINYINSFHDNIRVGIGTLKMKKINELDKMLMSKEEKEFIII